MYLKLGFLAGLRVGGHAGVFLGCCIYVSLHFPFSLTVNPNPALTVTFMDFIVMEVHLLWPRASAFDRKGLSIQM